MLAELLLQLEALQNRLIEMGIDIKKLLPEFEEFQASLQVCLKAFASPTSPTLIQKHDLHIMSEAQYHLLAELADRRVSHEDSAGYMTSPCLMDEICPSRLLNVHALQRELRLLDETTCQALLDILLDIAKLSVSVKDIFTNSYVTENAEKVDASIARESFILKLAIKLNDYREILEYTTDLHSRIRARRHHAEAMFPGRRGYSAFFKLEEELSEKFADHDARQAAKLDYLRNFLNDIIQMLEAAAHDGHPEAMGMIGFSKYHGKFVCCDTIFKSDYPADKQLGITLLERSSEQLKNKMHAALIGEHYLENKAYDRAIHWFILAAQFGSTDLAPSHLRALLQSDDVSETDKHNIAEFFVAEKARKALPDEVDNQMNDYPVIRHAPSIECEPLSSDSPELISAINSHDHAALTALLQAGVNPNRVTKESIPLFEAIKSRDIKTVYLLLQYGANPNITTNEYFAKNAYDALLSGFNISTHPKILPLCVYQTLSSKNDYFLIGQLLINYGFDINQMCDGMYTPMHWAAIKDDARMLQFLIKNKADSDPVDSLRRTPLSFALEYENQSAAHILLKNGASLSTFNLRSSMLCHPHIEEMLRTLGQPVPVFESGLAWHSMWGEHDDGCASSGPEVFNPAPGK